MKGGRYEEAEIHCKFRRKAATRSDGICNEPVGVWVQGPGPGLDLVIEFLPGNSEAREEAEWIINRLVENEVRTLPEDFLAYHQVTLSPYRGMRGPVVETEEYPSVEACARAVLDRLSSQPIARGPSPPSVPVIRGTRRLVSIGSARFHCR